MSNLPALLPGKLPGVFALVTEALLQNANGHPEELLIRRQWEKVLRAFLAHGLNTNTRPNIEEHGIDYTALLRDLPQGFESSQPN